MSKPDSRSHHYNRPSPPSLFVCEVHHTEHDAEVFILFMDYEGLVGMPVCKEIAPTIIRELANKPGVREVYSDPRTEFKGTIHGTLSTR